MKIFDVSFDVNVVVIFVIVVVKYCPKQSNKNIRPFDHDKE